MDTHTLVIDVIKLLRSRKKHTQKDLAAELKVSPTRVRNLENGKRSPTIEELFNLCDIYEVSWETFIHEVKRPVGRPKSDRSPYITADGRLDLFRIQAAGRDVQEVIDELTASGELK